MRKSGSSSISGSNFKTNFKNKSSTTGEDSQQNTFRTQGGGGGIGKLWANVKNKLWGKKEKHKSAGQKIAQYKNKGETSEKNQPGQANQSASNTLSWDKIKPANIHKQVSSFGSAHDDIFKRISDRFTILCIEKEITGCDQDPEEE